MELHVVLTKSEKGSLGFTVTKGSDNTGCYIHDVVQDPAKSDGRLRPGDRLIKVRTIFKSKKNMSCTRERNLEGTEVGSVLLPELVRLCKYCMDYANILDNTSSKLLFDSLFLV